MIATVQVGSSSAALGARRKSVGAVHMLLKNNQLSCALPDHRRKRSEKTHHADPVIFGQLKHIQQIAFCADASPHRCLLRQLC